MLKSRAAKLALLLLSAALMGQPTAAAQSAPTIASLSVADKQFMTDSREQLDVIARSQLGRQFSGAKDNDLDIIQTLLDRRLVNAHQTRELQAMGVYMGDILARELGMKWVIYSDRVGRSRALRMGQTDYYLFPVTMIARRVEADAPVDVKAVYDKAFELMVPYRRALPFQ